MNNSQDLLALEAKKVLKMKAILKEQKKKENYSRSKLRKHFEETKRLKE